MPDERDETRQFAPSDDATQAGDPPTRPDGDPTPGADETIADPARVPPVRDDATIVAGAAARDRGDAAAKRPDATSVLPSAGDETVADPARVPPVRDDATRVQGDAAAKRPDATSVLPPADDDWAPARGNPAWTGRAEVRAPRPSGATLAPDDWAVVPGREPRDRWWMPILVGIIALLLLASLGFGLYLIVQNSGGGDTTPTPTVTKTVAPTRTSTGSTAVTTEPTATTASTPTTEPTSTEVTIPALVGLSLPDAQAALSRMGLRRYKVIYRDDDAAPGTVIGSDPPEGQKVPPDTTVTLVVAKPSTSSPTTAATTTGSTQAPGGVGN
jgi:hypothetical protein